MKLYIMTLATVLSCTLGTLADHQNYWNLSAGWAQLSDSDISISGTDIGDVEYDAGWVIEGAVGRSINNTYAYELSLAYQNNEAQIADNINEDLSQLQFMLNGFYYLSMQDEFIPYLTAGIGLNRVNADINIELSEGSYSAKFDDINDTVFMGQVGAGICFKTSDMSCWDLRYKYLFAEDVELPFSATIESQVVSADLDFEIKGHQLLLGYIQLF